MSVIREEIVEEQRGRHGASQARIRRARADETEGGEAAIETVLMKVCDAFLTCAVVLVRVSFQVCTPAVLGLSFGTLGRFCEHLL